MIVEKSSSLTELIAKLHQAIADKDMPLVADVGEQIKKLNDEQARNSRKVVYVCNITHEAFSLTRTFGYVHILGAKKGERYTLTPIREYRDRIVYDDKHQINVTFPAAEVAEDIVRSCNSDAGDENFPNSFLGVFLPQGDEPSAEELESAEARLTQFYTHLVARADRRWANRHNVPAFITNAEIRAAEYLRVRREWLFTPEVNVECPICMQPMPKGAIIHAGPGACGQIVDRKRAIEAGIIPPDETPETEGMDVLDAPKTRTRKTPPAAKV